MGKINSKKKGAIGELELSKYLHGFGYEARRGRQYSGSPDSPDVVSDFPCHIECKRVENLNLAKAYEQSVSDASDKPPCVIHRKNRTPWMITLSLEHFIDLTKPTQRKETNDR